MWLVKFTPGLIIFVTLGNGVVGAVWDCHTAITAKLPLNFGVRKGSAKKVTTAGTPMTRPNN